MKYDVKSLTKSIIEISEGFGSDKHYLVNLKSIECIEMYTPGVYTTLDICILCKTLRFIFETRQEAMFLYNDITARMVLMEESNNSQFNNLPKELDELDRAMNLQR